MARWRPRERGTGGSPLGTGGHRRRVGFATGSLAVARFGGAASGRADRRCGSVGPGWAGCARAQSESGLSLAAGGARPAGWRVHAVLCGGQWIGGGAFDTGVCVGRMVKGMSSGSSPQVGGTDVLGGDRSLNDRSRALAEGSVGRVRGSVYPGALPARGPTPILSENSHLVMAR